MPGNINFFNNSQQKLYTTEKIIILRNLLLSQQKVFFFFKEKNISNLKLKISLLIFIIFINQNIIISMKEELSFFSSQVISIFTEYLIFKKKISYTIFFEQQKNNYGTKLNELQRRRRNLGIVVKYRNDFLLLSNRYRYYHYHITMEKKRREGVIYFSQTSQQRKQQRQIQQKKEQQKEQIKLNKHKAAEKYASPQIHQPNSIMPYSSTKKKTKENKEEEPQKQPPLTFFVLSFFQRLIKSKMYKYFSIIMLLFFLSACFTQGFEANPAAIYFGETSQKICYGFFILFLIIYLINCQKQEVWWVVLDLMTISAGILALILMDQEVVRYLKAIRTLKLLFLFKFVEFFNESILQVMNALKRVGKILTPVLIIIYLFAVVGLYAFVGKATGYLDMEYRKCRHPENKRKKKNWTAYEGEVFLCGGKRPCPIVDGIQYQCLNPVDYDVEPNPKQLINLTQGNGLLQYSNIGYAVFSTFKELYVTGSSRLIVLYKQTSSQLAVSLYYYSFILLIPYIYMNIFYGLLITAANQYREGHQQNRMIESSISEGEEDNLGQRRASIQEVSIQRNNKITSFYFQRTQKGIQMKKNSSNQQTFQESRQVIKHQNIFETLSIELHQKNHSGIDIAHISSQKYEKAQNNFFFKLRNYFSPILVSFAVINLSLDFEGQSEKFQFTTDCLYFFFLTIYYLQIMIKITQEIKGNKKLSQATKIDIFIGIICTIGVLYELIEAKNLIQFLACEHPQFEIFRTFMYLRVFVMIMDSEILEDFNRNISCISHGVWATRYFIVTWAFVMIILTIMGYHLHHGKTLLDQNGKLDLINGEPDQISFQTMYKALIFTILTVYDEQWDILMFKQYLGSGALIIIWQFITLTIGLLLLSKYLMCHLSQQIEQMLKKNPQENQEEQQVDEILQKSNMVSVNKIKHTEIENNNEEQEDCHIICFRKFRDTLKKIETSKVYTYIKTIITVGVLINIANKNPLISTDSPYFLLNIRVDSIILILLLIDLAINLLAYGLYSSQEAYIYKSYFSKINLFLLLIQILQVCAFYQYPWFRRLERIRFLRVFALIEMRYRSNWKMRIIIRSLKRLAVKILQIIIFSLLIYYFFALILTKCFKNDYFYCDNANQNGIILTKEDCLNWGGDWIQKKLNFSNPLSSLLYLFLVATMEGWITQMQQAMNLNGEGFAPIKNANAGIEVFFILFFFFGNLIILNSVISISLFNYKTIKEKQTGQNMITKNEKTWLQVKLKILQLNPIYQETEPSNFLRKYLYRLSNHNIFTGFKIFNFICIIVTLSLYSTTKKPKLLQFLQNFWKYCVLLQVIEYVIELMAFGCSLSKRRQLTIEGILIAYSLIYYISNFSGYIEGETARYLGSLFIIFQVYRYTNLLNEIPIVNKILNSLLTILPKTSNIMLLLATILYIYAIIGIQLFAFLRPNQELDLYNQNYKTFGMAIFALVKFIIMESPIGQISDASQGMSPNFVCHEITTYSDYEKFGDNGCGSKISSYLFFLSFHIFYSLFLMSNFLAFIADSYDQVRRSEQAHVSKHFLKKILKIWVEKDPQATGYIGYRQFWMFTKKILDLFNQNLKKNKKKLCPEEILKEKKNLLSSLDVNIYEREQGKDFCFQFHETIESLTRIYIEKLLLTKINQKQIQSFFKDHNSEREESLQKRKKTGFRSSQIYSLILLKSGLKIWKKKIQRNKIWLHYGNLLTTVK